MQHRKKATVGKAKHVSTWSQDIRELSAVLKCGTQEEFAARLGSKQGTVSTWLRGDEARRPSADTFVSMAGLAAKLNPELASRFLRHAHISDETIFSIAERLLKNRAAPPKEGEIIRVPRFHASLKGPLSAGTPIPLPLEFIPNPGSTICLLLDENSPNVVGSPKGAVLLDTSYQGQRLGELWERVVMLAYDASKGAEAYWRSGLYMGRIGMFEHVDRAPELVVFPKLDILSSGFDAGIPFWLGEYREPVAVSPEQEELWKSAVQAFRERARLKFELPRACRILGKVIGRLTGHLERQSEKR